MVPAYNEARTIEEVLGRISCIPREKEIIVVDDRSTDGTRELLKGMKIPGLKVVYHEKNEGKGAAIRSGLREATGDAVIIQDADLEYDPAECEILLRVMERHGAQVVYGSRFRGGGVFLLSSRLANRFLTGLTNLLYQTHLSDMETCYKMMKTEIARSLDIRSSGFEIEPEVTAKLLKRGYRIWEVPVSYHGRRSSEGKKIGWRDGVKAALTLVRYRFTE